MSSERVCTFNVDGFCRVAVEFPELKDKPCSFNESGFCVAEAGDLVKICPDCGFSHKAGDCDETQEDTFWVPKNKK